ncbi:D-threo-aldose 1-dehydrogenase [Salinisphaera orenii MK-B5]|uniref:D-threo-aldose 1-dehydrogenase n=1 Tax=Salinisphaera orenii MK-B5 TaxID=856730 RepID=A0A423PFG7_9GAMM|nr:aldo/keto reductase [Salinisphaera orenii]ROO24283.1 D-threo-aldose 1-dehydrogenase [Salinisphaera orenii MK-B5]
MSDFKNTGPALDRMGFGGAPLGDMFAHSDDDHARDTLAAAWDQGIRYFDTAPHYGAGLSEQRFGSFLARKPRSEYILSTKVGRVLEPAREPEATGPFVGGLYFKRRMDYSYEGAKQSVHDSLQRMGVGHLDIVYIHDLSPDALGDEWTEHFDTAMSGAAVALTEMREEGLIRGWGLGVNTIEPCLRALDEADPDVFLLATQYHLLNTAGADELFPRCLERNVGVVVGAPFGSGLLAGGDHYMYEKADDEITRTRDRMAAICERHGVDLKAAAMQFSAAHPAVSSIIPGASKPERIPQNRALFDADIPAELWAEFKREGLLSESAHTPA